MKSIKVIFTIIVIFLFIGLITTCDIFQLQPRVNENDPNNELGLVLEVPRNGLVEEYLFDGGTNDSSGNGNNGTVNGATLITDRFGNTGNAYSFDEVDDYISFPYFLTNGSKTFSAWFKTDYLSSTNRRLIGFDGGYFQDLWAIWINTDGFLGFNTRDIIDNAKSLQMNIETVVADNVWYYVAVTINPTNKICKIFFDGNLEAINYDATSTFEMFDHEIYLMWDNFNSSGDLFMPGNIDDIRIYNRALSEAEIMALYQDTHLYVWSS